MDDDEMLYDNDSGNEESDMEDDDDDDNFVDIGVDVEPSSAQEKHEVEDFPYEVLTPDYIVQHMVDCIKEVNAVVEVHVL